MVSGKARKSTHAKRNPGATSAAKRSSTRGASKSPEKSANVVKIDPARVIKMHEPERKYEIAAVGPIYLSWGKKRVKNAKGKIVKEYYIKKDSKHLIWVKWVDPFQDTHEKDDEFWTKWSAEPQEVFEGPHMKGIVKEVLDSKTCWPWIQAGDENAEDRKALLKTKNYKEWKDNSKAKGPKNKWSLKLAQEVQTVDPLDDRSSGNSDSESDSTSANEVDNEEEEDEV